MGIVTLQCSCCGKRRSVVYTASNAASIIKEGWGSYGSALYCPKCTRTWDERNGANRPMPGKYNTLRIIDELYIKSAPKHVVEYCSECETENEFRWDVNAEGFKAYCPHCGAVLMLCDECVHREDSPWHCTDNSTPKGECARTINLIEEEHK